MVSLKNKKLNFPKNLKTRPLKDSVKENIFNILNTLIKSKSNLKIQIYLIYILDVVPLELKHFREKRLQFYLLKMTIKLWIV